MEKKIVAVCACIAGVAHTYMSKANLEKHGKAQGIKVKVETQGAMGIEGRLSQSDIDEADVVIFAVDTNVANRDRFVGKTILEVNTKEAVKHGQEVIEKAIALMK